jgi:ribosomal protein S18 acetylase RimI-like enzyme/predicted nucleic acid-binding protein
MTIEFIDNRNRFFEDVKALGRKNSATLGFMPEGGFEDHARNKFIIIAHDGKTLAGYLMFRVVSRFSRVSIVHLCVSEEYRGKGVSTTLLNALKRKFEKVYRGISLSCRTDFDYASSVWRNFGFVPREKVRSRSYEVNYLNRWWYDFNQPDLFSVALTSKVKALLDMNIIVKLREAENANYVSPQEDPCGLLADWLIDETELCFAPEAFNEIDRDENLQRAARTRALLSSFTQLQVDVEEQKKVVKDLEQIISGKSDNDISDRKQIASCIVSQTPYFITYDEGLINKRDIIEKQYSLQIYNPQEFIMQVDQLLHGEEYLPNQLIGVTSDYVSKPSPQELSNCVNRFWMQKEGEDKPTFNSLVSELINKNEGKLYVLKRHGDAIAFYGITEKKDSTDIEFLRICDKDICNALFFQIISEILKRILKSEKTQIVFKEKYITEKQKDILDKFGFVLQNNLYVKYVYNIIVAKEEVSNIINQSYPSMTVDNNDRLLLAVERKLFPLKIKGLNIPTYIVPIMPYWAGQLFDLTIAGEDLFGANPEKLWSFENVYYRHTKPITEKYPARILWYVSGGDKYSHTKSIVASSYLTEVMTGKPKDLFHVNRRYGIYEWKDIYKLCDGDINTDIRALKFCHTEVFDYPVKFDKIQEILFSNGRKRNTFASPVEINDIIFFQIYQLGKWKEQK